MKVYADVKWSYMQLVQASSPIKPMQGAVHWHSTRMFIILANRVAVEHSYKNIISTKALAAQPSCNQEPGLITSFLIHPFVWIFIYREFWNCLISVDEIYKWLVLSLVISTFSLHVIVIPVESLSLDIWPTRSAVWTNCLQHSHLDRYANRKCLVFCTVIKL